MYYLNEGHNFRGLRHCPSCIYMVNFKKYKASGIKTYLFWCKTLLKSMIFHNTHSPLYT